MVMTGDDSMGILVLCVLGLCREYDVEEEDGAEMLSHLGDRLGRCPFLRGSTEGLFAGLGSGATLGTLSCLEAIQGLVEHDLSMLAKKLC